ncbi:MAG: spore germination protein, partial [Oscillospiraceae bacterium]
MNGRQLSDFESTQLTESLEENLRFLHRIFEKDQILRVRHLSMERCVSIPCALLFIDSMVNSASLNDSVVRPLLEADVPNRQRTLVDYVCRQVLFACEVKATANLREMLRSMLYGDTLLLIDGCNEGIVINTKGWPTRGVTEPEDERILQGPREGFGEAAMKNITLLRRRLPTPDFCVETQYLGRRTDTLVMICYLGSLVKPQTLAMLKERLAKVDIDSVLDTNYIAEMIRDHRLSLFKTTGSTERPDIVAARLLEGRVALVVDGTPVVLTIPYLFVENFQSDDDYYLNFWVATVGRMLRHVCFFLSFSLPALYLALV